jgi:coenzyme F420-dependent glucose-6-phosphate dehydrogenase
MLTAPIGYHASHELYPPSELLRFAKRAEQAGFAIGTCSDHFHPWTEQSRGCGFAWSWLGTALQATNLTYGTVCAPGQRYHPAIIAQAVATLIEMYPGRFWLAVGSGEALNESITRTGWPPKAERNARLREAVEVMRALWRGEPVTRQGEIQIDEAQLTLRPPERPPVIAAAMTPETAYWAASWADGLITAGCQHEDLRKIVHAFHDGGGEYKPLYLQTAVSYGTSDHEALLAAHAHWPQAGLELSQLADIATPRAFDQAVAIVRPEDLSNAVRCSATWQQHVEWLQEDIAMGFSAIYLHYLGNNIEQFIDMCGEHVLPVVQDPII